jgi:F-type H+-transporting ATPase subunit gamma
MAKSRKILARRRAVRNIRTVTKTMEMVASARFRQAYRRYSDAGQYLRGMDELVEEVFARCESRRLRHPLLREPRKKASARLLLVVTSDRGLCGGFNTAILKCATDRIEALRGRGGAARLHVVGKKGVSQLAAAGLEPEKTYTDFDAQGISWHRTSALAESFMSEFLAGGVRAVEIVSAELLGAGGYRPTRITLLPMRPEESTNDANEDEIEERPQDDFTNEEKNKKKFTGSASDSSIRNPKSENRNEDAWEPYEPYQPYEPYEPLERWEPLPPPEMEYEFIPSAENMLARLLPMAVRLKVYEIFVEALVAEQRARIAAMHAASENAEEMIQRLTVQYNRTRQAQITTELAEIMGGRSALE